MNRVRTIDAANYTITAEAGCILAQVQETASEADRLVHERLPSPQATIAP